MRHRVLGALGAAGAPHHVLDLRERAQHVLDAVVQPVDLSSEASAAARSAQERALVELGHEVAAEPQATTTAAGMISASDATRTSPRVAHAARRGAARSALERADEPDVLGLARARRAQQRGRQRPAPA